MALWINFLWNNSFVNPTQLHLLCEETGDSGTGSYGRQAGRPLGSRNCCKVTNFKFCIFDF